MRKEEVSLTSVTSCLQSDENTTKVGLRRRTPGCCRQGTLYTFLANQGTFRFIVPALEQDTRLPAYHWSLSHTFHQSTKRHTSVVAVLVRF